MRALVLAAGLVAAFCQSSWSEGLRGSVGPEAVPLQAAAAQPAALERDAERRCFPSTRLLTRLDAMRAHRAVYEGDAVRRAEQIYAATPPSGAAPHADHLIVADLPTGSVALLFVRGEAICATMMIADRKVAALARTFILGVEV